jgi:hypothetical protein
MIRRIIGFTGFQSCKSLNPINPGSDSLEGKGMAILADDLENGNNLN